MAREILHVDMDAFFAAVEQRDRPELRGQPVLVGGAAERRGVVAAASYEARAFGARSALPMATALRLCPQAIVVPGRHGRYREVSRQLFRLFEEFTPLVEPLSIDEAFLDLTGCDPLFGGALVAARQLRARVRAETGLAASVGVAPNKFLAKLASDLSKPDGLLLITPATAQATLDPLPVERLWGVGRATLRRFHDLGARTVADVRRMPLARLRREFGAAGEQFHRLARGDDERPVTTDQAAKSVSQEVTFARDVTDLDHLRTVLLHQVEDLAYRLRRMERLAGTLTLKIRYPDFATITRAAPLPSPTQATEPLCRAAVAGFDHWAATRPAPVRLLGAAAGNLFPPESSQLSLFEDDTRRRRLDAAVDALRERFGPDAVRRRGVTG